MVTARQGVQNMLITESLVKRNGLFRLDIDGFSGLPFHLICWIQNVCDSSLLLVLTYSWREQLPPQSGVILFPAFISFGAKVNVFWQLIWEKEKRLAFKYILSHSSGSCRSYITSPSTVILKRPPFREMAQVLYFSLLTSFKAGGVLHVAHPSRMISLRLNLSSLIRRPSSL